MFPRVLPPPGESAFLLGPRATGKSTWLQQHFADAVSYDLLDTSLALRLAREPALLAREIEGLGLEPGAWVVIDEIQKVPALLDEVHRLMQRRGIRFLLSGSSARKLKRGGANLLAGRALRQDFFPLVSKELGAARKIDEIVFGTLPQAVLSERPQSYLVAYTETYIKEEVQAEALTRNVGGFARFLEVAARQNGMVTSTASIARDAQVARQTVQGYFEVLVDTLLGFWLPAWRPKRATKVVSHPKFYLFDAGVARALSGRIAYPPTSEEFGPIFETYLLHEIRAWLSYSGHAYPLAYFRTHDGVEVDLLLESVRGHIAIEIKAGREWRSGFSKGLRRISEEIPGVRCFGVFTGTRPQKVEGVEVLPYARFLERLWEGTLID